MQWLGAAMLASALAACLPDAAPTTTAGASAERGRLLLEQYDCGSCHAIPGVRRSQGQTGPALLAYARRAYIAGELPNQPEVLHQWIQDPRALVPDTLMPVQDVPENHARDMAAYLMGLH